MQPSSQAKPGTRLLVNGNEERIHDNFQTSTADCKRQDNPKGWRGVCSTFSTRLDKKAFNSPEC
jgi:hypothetical protein